MSIDVKALAEKLGEDLEFMVCPHKGDPFYRELAGSLLARLVPAEDGPDAMALAREAVRQWGSVPAEDEGRLREAAQNVVGEYDKTHLRHDVAYDEVADAIDRLRAALAATPEPR